MKFEVIYEDAPAIRELRDAYLNERVDQTAADIFAGDFGVVDLMHACLDLVVEVFLLAAEVVADVMMALTGKAR